MAIGADVLTHSIGELLGDGDVHDARGMDLRIPDYQRPYEWTPELALQLFDDLAQAVGPAGESLSRSWSAVEEALDQGRDPRPTYMIGSLILHTRSQPTTSGTVADEPGPQLAHDVVDGQQRLITLLLLRRELHTRSGRVPAYAPRDEDDGPSPARLVQEALRFRLRPLDSDERAACWRVISLRARMAVITTDDLDEAFSIFDAQNTRGRGLAPHDLLKAHHLREMRHDGEARRIAAIEKWERTDQEDLRRLFSRYLYRIARWSQGLEARSFTVQDIDMFKGISVSGRRTPTQHYHAAAQAMIPAILQWDPSTAGSDGGLEWRRMNHARFRLDSPVIAGGPFFEMVDFFLGELRRLRQDKRVVPRPLSTDDPPDAGEEGADWESIFGTRADEGYELIVHPSRSTTYYVSELYLAVMLYAVNCFGEGAITDAAPLLRRWAFAPRTVKHSVREASIDLHSTDAESLFPLLHRSRELAHLLRHPVPLPERDKVAPLGQDVGWQILLEAGVDPRTVYPDDEGSA